jgi:hypothetical protein
MDMRHVHHSRIFVAVASLLWLLFIFHTLFAGRQMKFPAGTFRGGYGHMGCCSLLAIQQVVSVDAQDRADLDYLSLTDAPDIEKTGCGYQRLTDSHPYDDVFKAQRAAEQGQTAWAFVDTQRVASDALGRLVQLNETSLKGIRPTRKAQGRIVYEWRPKAKRASDTVVVSRPYWLSFHAKDPQRVAWTVIAVYK